MEPFRIITADDDAVQVPFAVPIKGRDVPLTFSVPRMQFLSEPTAREMRKALRALDDPAPVVDDDGKPVYETGSVGSDGEPVQKVAVPQRTIHEQNRVTCLAMLKCVTSATVYKVLEKLTVGELDQIVAHWTEVSGRRLDEVTGDGATPGESSASSSS
ncbi:hypothetical protein [Mycolicibacterium fortuitum]|uniref:hypothetical protein n=1 Tax=Mycolicibacterium fortuitum TaxID=1766 RepID=UPI002631D5E3|nr:hypothetical protein [Mycolicibacterium fortuitum]